VSIGLWGVGCDDKKDEPQYTLVEYVKIEGRCHENHVQEWGNYRGSIVHWHNDTDGTNSRYGSVMNTEAMSGQLIDEIEHPNRYRPPFMVQLWDVPAEMLTKQQMVLAGISEPVAAEENSKVPGYESTCEVAVVSRAHEFPPDADRW
jgi:hypothetical protein